MMAEGQNGGDGGHFKGETVKSPFLIAAFPLGRVDKIEIFVIPAKAGIYEDVHQVIIGLKTPGFRFKTGMTGYLSTRPNKDYLFKRALRNL